VNIHNGAWVKSGHKCLSGEMVDYSHKVSNHYQSLLQNHLQDHLSDMDTFHHSAMARMVKLLEAHDTIYVNEPLTP